RPPTSPPFPYTTLFRSDGSPPPKYVNSSESFLFHKSKTLFGLAVARPAIRDKGRAILVEGNLDVVKLHQQGHGETVAPLGTSFRSEEHTSELQSRENLV